jgi:hypothetical protein
VLPAGWGAKAQGVGGRGQAPASAVVFPPVFADAALAGRQAAQRARFECLGKLRWPDGKTGDVHQQRSLRDHWSLPRGGALPVTHHPREVRTFKR